MLQLKRFYDDKAGNFSIAFAVSILVILMAVGAALDASRLLSMKQSAQSTVDSAVLATAVEMTALKDPNSVNIKKLATEFLDSNGSGTIGDITLEKGAYNETENEITIIGNVQVESTFMSMFGVDMLNAKIESVSGPISREANIDVVLVLDNTDSMSTSEINTLVSSSQDLVDFLHDNKGTADIRVGVVPFSRYVNIGASNSNVQWIDYNNAYNPDNQPFQGCVSPFFNDSDGDPNFIPSSSTPLKAAYDYNKYPNTSSAPATPYALSQPDWWRYRWDSAQCRLSEVTPLTNSRSFTKSRLNNIKNNIGGPTYLPSGLMWGRMFINEEGPILPLTPSSSTFRTKVIVLMTDGANKLYWIREGQAPEDIRTDPETDNLTKNMCNDIKAKGIKILVIGYRLDGTDSDSIRARDVVGDCASNPNSVYNPNNTSELTDTFAEVSKAILEQNIRIIR